MAWTAGGIGMPASMSVENSPTIALFSTATAPISMTRWPWRGERPVVSRSTTMPIERIYRYSHGDGSFSQADDGKDEEEQPFFLEPV
jgi:hypothetical protein